MFYKKRIKELERQVQLLLKKDSNLCQFVQVICDKNLLEFTAEEVTCLKRVASVGMKEEHYAIKEVVERLDDVTNQLESYYGKGVVERAKQQKGIKENTEKCTRNSYVCHKEEK